MRDIGERGLGYAASRQSKSDTVTGFPVTETEACAGALWECLETGYESLERGTRSLHLVDWALETRMAPLETGMEALE